MKPLITFLLLCLAFSAGAENLFVRPNGGAYGSENGADWDNAFDGFADVLWGSGALSVGAGDTLYVGAGTYTGGTVGASGTTNNPITIRAAQETHIGVATFTSNLSLGSRDYITVDGEYNGARNIHMDGCAVDGYATGYAHIRFVECSDTDIGISLAGTVADLGGIVDNCYLRGINEAAGVSCVGRNYHNVGYDAVHIKNSIFNLNRLATSVNGSGGLAGSGNGPDGIYGCWGLTVSNCLFTNIVGTVNPLSGENYEHQDYIQMQAGFVKILNCTFVNPADAAIGCDTYQGGPAFNHIIANNLFILRSGSGPRYYGDVNFPMTNVYFINNTLVDHTSEHQWAFHIAGSGEVTFAENVYIQNNIFRNCLGIDANGTAMQIEAANVTAAGFHVDYNWHEQALTVDGTANYSQTHNFAGAITFAGYTENSDTSNMRLAAADTGAKDLGADWSSVITIDRDFVSRPQGAAFDLGAFEYASGGGGAPASSAVTIQSATVGTMIIQ